MDIAKQLMFSFKPQETVTHKLPLFVLHYSTLNGEVKQISLDQFVLKNMTFWKSSPCDVMKGTDTSLLSIQPDVQTAHWDHLKTTLLECFCGML